MKRRRASIFYVIIHDRSQIEPLAHHASYKVAYVIVRHKVLYRWWKQKYLLVVPVFKFLAHRIFLSPFQGTSDPNFLTYFGDRLSRGDQEVAFAYYLEVRIRK